MWCRPSMAQHRAHLVPRTWDPSQCLEAQAVSSSQPDPRFHVPYGGMYTGLSIPSPVVTLHLLRQQTQCRLWLSKQGKATFLSHPPAFSDILPLDPQGCYAHSSETPSGRLGMFGCSPKEVFLHRTQGRRGLFTRGRQGSNPFLSS